MKKNIKARRVFLNYSKQNVNFITFECLSILRGTFQNYSKQNGNFITFECLSILRGTFQNANETIAVREECNVKVGIQ